MYRFNKSINKIINSNNTNNSFSKAILHSINNKDLISKNLINTYFDNSNFTLSSNKEENKVKNYIIISKPEINHTVESVNVNLFYYLSNKDKMEAFIENEKVVNLSKVLSTIYGKSVNIHMTRIHYPYMNSNILSKYITKNASTNNFQHFVDSIITYPNLSPTGNDSIYSEESNTLPSFITDITIQLSGRLVTEKVIPRVTKKISRISTNQVSIGTKLKSYGFNENSERNVFVDKSSFTSKNHLGTFTVKVSITSLIANT